MTYQRSDLVAAAASVADQQAPSSAAQGDSTPANGQDGVQTAGEKPQVKSAEDQTVEILTERSIEPKAGRLDYEFGMTIGYDSNPAGLPGNSVLGDTRTAAKPKGSTDTLESGRLIYRLAGDANAGLSIRGDINLEQYAELHDFDTRDVTGGFNAYKTFHDKYRLTGDISISSINFDGKHLVDVKSALGELAWQHNDLHRSLVDISISRREFVVKSPDELDEDGLIYSIQARHDAGFDVFGKRAVVIGLVNYGRDDTQGDSAKNQFVSGASQVLYLISPKWIVDGSYSYRFNDYDNPNVLTDFETARRDITRSYSVGLRWVPIDALNVSADVTRLTAASNISDFYSFDRTVGTITVEWRGEQ